MPSRVIIVSDGKRGHENQSRVVAAMLGDREPLLMFLKDAVRNGGPIEMLLRLRLATGGRRSVSPRQCVPLVKRFLKPETPDQMRQLAELVREHQGGLKLFCVSTGTPPATLNLIIARMLGAKCIVNMTPSLLPRQLFDLNIVPAHDLAESTALTDNMVVSPLALGYHDEPAAQLLAGQLIRDHGLERGRKYWGVAIGGPSKACPWSADRVLDELAMLHGLARGMGAQLLVTTSRRTPAHCLKWLASQYLGSPQLAYFLNAAEDPLNPLPAIYELSELMFVTGDSFSMVSEALQAGHKPVILNVRVGLAPGKLGRAMAALAATGQVYVGVGEDELPVRVPDPPDPRGPVNEPYDELRRVVRRKLGMANGD